MKKKKDLGYVLKGDQIKKVTSKQRFVQWWYGFFEPYLIRYGNYMLKTKKNTKKYIKQSKPKCLPSGVIISTDAACRFIDFIYEAKSDNITPRMAVTKCVCQTALKKYKEPIKKDIALLYAADMYTSMKRTGIKEKFEVIKTAEEAKKMIRYFDECGLMHNVLYCNHSGKWTFVMCNCDNEICVPFRSYMAGRKEEMSAGPEIISYDKDKCIGINNCGKCLERCILKACSVGDDGKCKVTKEDCLGCGLCVATCEGNARSLVPREDYKHEDVLTTKILLGNK